MKCVILCAGKGTRMGSKTPKALVPVNGKPLLYHVIDMWKNSVDDFIFVVGYRWKDVVSFLPWGSSYVIQDPLKGIADAILQAEPYIDREFLVALGDCLQKGTWEAHSELPEQGVGIWKNALVEELKKSYSVVVSDGFIEEVIEKPTLGLSWKYCGMGTYFLDKRVFDYIRKTPISSLRNEVEITDTIQLMINSGERISPFFFNGKYLNVTSPEDIKKAEELLSE